MTDTATMTSRKRDYLLVLLGDAGVILVVQLLPMLGMGVLDYAVFSSIYLGYAAIVAVKFALISDIWGRELGHEEAPVGLVHAFESVLTTLALLGALVVGVVTVVLTRDPVLAVLSVVAVGAAVFRAGIAYRLIAIGRARLVGITEILGAGVAGLAVGAVWFAGAYSVTSAVACWALAPIVASLCTRVAPRPSPAGTVRWFREHHMSMGVLGTESGIKTLEAVGTPYVLGILGGATALALYRAGSSVTYPVRMVLDSIRARIVGGAIELNARILLVLVALGLAGGLAAGGVLAVAAALDFDEESVFGLLSHHAVAVGCWVAVTALTTFMQFWARGAMTGRALVSRRIAHTLVIVVGTAGSVLVFGPASVLWAAVVTHALTVPLWMFAPRREGRR